MITTQDLYNLALEKIIHNKTISYSKLICDIRESVSTDIDKEQINVLYKHLQHNPNIKFEPNANLGCSEIRYTGPTLQDIFMPIIYRITDDCIKNIECARVDSMIARIQNEFIGQISTVDGILEIIRDIIDANDDIILYGQLHSFDGNAKIINMKNLVSEEEYSTNTNTQDYVNINEKSEPKFKCSKCGGNVRKYLNIRLMSNPPKYKYECDNCGNITYHAK